MAVPRNRLSNARKNSKRAHHAKKPKNPTACSNCGSFRIQHHACSACGFYDGRPFLKKEEESKQ